MLGNLRLRCVVTIVLREEFIMLLKNVVFTVVSIDFMRCGVLVTEVTEMVVIHRFLTTQLELKLPESGCVVPKRSVPSFMPGETEGHDSSPSKRQAGSLPTHPSWETQGGCVDMDIAVMLREETRKVQQSMQELFAKQSQTLAELQHQISSIAHQQANPAETEKWRWFFCCDYFGIVDL